MSMFRRFRSYRSHKHDDEQTLPPLPANAATSFLDPNDLLASAPYRQRMRSSARSVPVDIMQRPAQLGRNSSYVNVDRSPSPVTRGEKFGLKPLYKPSSPALVDIIFVHGLGGDSCKTWSKNRDPSLFWPRLWLPLESDIDRARIFTFGYNAGFHTGGKSIANIADFGKELLFEMKFGKDEYGGDLEIGSIPIIFVAHSMGGLVVKKAFLLGQNDEEYQDIILSISAIMFLSTPHRGASMAELVSRILAVSFQSKSFVRDLEKNSLALEDLNEQFRHVASKLSIVSFYETLATRLGPKKLIVVEKDSSILGYPKEISKSLNADHHDVCKYSSPLDANYISVRNALKTLVTRFKSKGNNVVSSRVPEEMKEIEKLFAVRRAPEDEYNFFRRRWTPGTCDWVLSEPGIKVWLDETLDSRVVWLSAPPASGKSITAAHIVHYLHSSGYSCQYYFFRFGDQTKRTLNALIRSLAFQVAKDIPVFRRSLLELAAEGLTFEKTDPFIIWQKVMESILFTIELPHPLYWVIDALDESDSSRGLFNLLSNLNNSCTSIRILVISRSTGPLSRAFNDLSNIVNVEHIEKDGSDFNSVDVQVLVRKEIRHMRGSPSLKEEISSNILRRADGNFLWVRLVLEEIASCHTVQSILETLEGTPPDMNGFYRRMNEAIASSSRKSDRELAKMLLQWTVCANRSLTLKELAQALQPEFPEFLDLKETIQDVCKSYVVVDQNSRVLMVHQTAREYLTKTPDLQISIDLKEAHEQLFKRTMSCLLDEKLRSKLTQGRKAFQLTNPFLSYASTSWIYHLRHSATTSEDVFDLLVRFFSNLAVLTWIQALALNGELEILVQAAKTLISFLGLKRKANPNLNMMLHRLGDMELLESWASDLLRLAGKFSVQLFVDPTSIYKLIPPFCPENSIIHRKFHNPASAEITISGISNKSWNDNLARISLPNGEQAWEVTCAGQFVAVLTSAERIIVWKSTSFEEICALRHGEPVTALCFNEKVDKLVTSGLKSTKIWSIPSSQLLSSTLNAVDAKAMTIKFAANDTKVITGSDDKIVRWLSMERPDLGWQVMDATLLKESPQTEGVIVGSPMWMAFNADASQIGVSYRGFPLSAWSTSDARLINRCRRVKDYKASHVRPSTSWFAVDRFTWNPVTGHIIGCYRDGCVFKWHPVSEENQEAIAVADEIAASSDGKLFATSSSNGSIKVWNFAFFTPIYHLSSGDLVTGLTFAPDCRRFYDVRGSIINAWEPNSLIQLAEIDDSMSDSASESHLSTAISQASEVLVAQFEPVSALSSNAGSSLYCFGNEEGVVELFELDTGKVCEVTKFMNFMSVNHLSWSGDGLHVVAADLSGDISLRRLSYTVADESAPCSSMEIVSSPKIGLDGHGIRQILLDQESRLVLVISDDRCYLWSVAEAKTLVSRDLIDDIPRVWLQNPLSGDELLAFGPNDVKIYQWHDLAQVSSSRYKMKHLRQGSQPLENFRSDIPSLSEALTSLEVKSFHATATSTSKAFLTQDRKHILLQVAENSFQERVNSRVLIFDLSSISDALKAKSVPFLTFSHIPEGVIENVEIPLGILLGSRFVFLDHNLWICTFKLGSTYDEDGIKRHYFIPRDWVTTSSLDFCCLLEDGTLLCPKDGEVAVIRSDLVRDDF